MKHKMKFKELKIELTSFDEPKNRSPDFIDGAEYQHQISAKTISELLEALQIATRLIGVAENNGAYKDCSLPLIGKKSLEKMEALLERLK